jgi:hypothetical protein
MQFPHCQERLKETQSYKEFFSQLSKKLDELKKALKKSSLRSKKHCYEDSNSDSK